MDDDDFIDKMEFIRFLFFIKFFGKNVILDLDILIMLWIVIMVSIRFSWKCLIMFVKNVE